MPGPSTLQRGNISLEMLLSVNIAAGTVGTTTAAVVTVSVPGLLVGDAVTLIPALNLWPASQPAAVMDVYGYVSSNNVLSCSFYQGTASVATQTTAVQYLVNVCRPENYAIAGTYPSAIV
jgi:hypothetical protein